MIYFFLYLFLLSYIIYSIIKSFPIKNIAKIIQDNLSARESLAKNESERKALNFRINILDSELQALSREKSSNSNSNNFDLLKIINTEKDSLVQLNKDFEKKIIDKKNHLKSLDEELITQLNQLKAHYSQIQVKDKQNMTEHIKLISSPSSCRTKEKTSNIYNNSNNAVINNNNNNESNKNLSNNLFCISNLISNNNSNLNKNEDVPSKNKYKTITYENEESTTRNKLNIKNNMFSHNDSNIYNINKNYNSPNSDKTLITDTSNFPLNDKSGLSNKNSNQDYKNKNNSNFNNYLYNSPQHESSNFIGNAFAYKQSNFANINNKSILDSNNDFSLSYSINNKLLPKHIESSSNQGKSDKEDILNNFKTENYNSDTNTNNSQGNNFAGNVNMNLQSVNVNNNFLNNNKEKSSTYSNFNSNFLSKNFNISNANNTNTNIRSLSNLEIYSDDSFYNFPLKMENPNLNYNNNTNNHNNASLKSHLRNKSSVALEDQIIDELINEENSYNIIIEKNQVQNSNNNLNFNYRSSGNSNDNYSNNNYYHFNSIDNDNFINMRSSELYNKTYNIINNSNNNNNNNKIDNHVFYKNNQKSHNSLDNYA